MGARRRLSRAYQQEAVRRVTQRGVPVAQAARDLGLQKNVRRRWSREHGADPVQAFPGEGQQKPDDAAAPAGSTLRSSGPPRVGSPSPLYGDWYARQILGWAMHATRPTQLVADALPMAIW
jgi:transposase